MHDTEGETIESVKRERDELGRMVAACVEHIDVVERILGDHEEEGGVFIPRADLPKRFSRPDVAAERGRWVTLEACDARHLSHRDSLMRDMDRVAADIRTARAERDELGIQLEALRERMRLAMAVVHAARFACRPMAYLEQTIGAFYTVPGDEEEKP